METEANSVRISSTSQELYISSVELSALLKVTDSHLSQLARSSILVRRPDPYDSRAYIYPVFENITRYVLHTRERRERAYAVYLEEKSRTQKAQRIKIELRNAIDTGRTVEKVKLIAVLEPIVVAFRNAMLTRADRLERKLAYVKGRKARVETIRTDTLDLLSVLADLINPLVLAKNGDSAQKEGL